MDRRRFVPQGDNLEGRQLLASFARTSVGLVNTEVPLSTLQQRWQRIDRLPYFLQTINPKASIPAAGPIATLQDNLRLLLGTMHATNRNGLVAFNKLLRQVVKQQTVSVVQAGQLSDTFGKILLAAGADGTVVSALREGMNDLTRVTVASTNESSSLVANEYALVLELALAVGKPLPAPGVPRIAQSDNSPPRNDRRTTNPRPTLTGNYEANTFVQIVDPKSQAVLGTAPVGHDGKYRVQFDSPLAPGTYTIRIRAVGPQGATSLMSRPFRLTILPATPAGPRMLMR